MPRTLRSTTPTSTGRPTGFNPQEVIDDLPISFPDSVASGNEIIRIPSDAAAQWDMARWAKSRGGVFLADRWGPTYVPGGEAVATSTPYQFVISECEAWPVEEVLQEERVAERCLSDANVVTIDPSSPVTIIAMVPGPDRGRIVTYPVTPPSIEENKFYYEVSNLANVIVPLWAVVLDRAYTASQWVLAGNGTLRDLRLRPYELLYRDDPNSVGGADDGYLLPYEASDVTQGGLSLATEAIGRWTLVRTHRLWLYAPAGALFEVGGMITHLRPWEWRNVNGRDPAQSYQQDGRHGFFLGGGTQDEQKIQRKLSFYINQTLVGASLDKASGVEVVTGLTQAVTQANTYNTVATGIGPLMLRTVFRLLGNILHDITLATWIDEGGAFQYQVHAQAPQLWARLVNGEPQ